MESSSRKKRKRIQYSEHEDEDENGNESEDENGNESEDENGNESEYENGNESENEINNGNESQQEYDEENSFENEHTKRKKREKDELLNRKVEDLEMRALLPMIPAVEFLASVSDNINTTPGDITRGPQGSEGTKTKPPRRTKYLQFIETIDDEKPLEKFLKGPYSKVISGDMKNRWKKHILNNKGETTPMKNLLDQSKSEIDALVLRESYLNTVAPNHDDVQNIPVMQHLNSTTDTAKLSRSRRRMLVREMANQAGGSDAQEVRYSKQCTSCMLQGFECSGHKPICSQCYYSSSRTTLSLSRNVSPTGDPIPSSCSYPVEGKPLIPGHVFRSLRDQVEEESNVAKDKRLPMEDIQKAIKKLSVAKDESKDVGWKVSFRGNPLMDKNPATDVDYLIKSDPTTAFKAYNHLKIRDALKTDDQRSVQVDGSKDKVGEGETASVGHLATEKPKDALQKRFKTKWIEHALLEEDGQTENDTLDGKDLRRKPGPVLAHALTGNEPLIRFNLGDGSTDRRGRREQALLAFGRSSREALIEENNRSGFGEANKLLRRTSAKVRNAEKSLSGKWDVGNHPGTSSTTASAMTGTEAEENSDAESAIGEQLPTSKDDVIELDIGGMKIKRNVRLAKVRKDHIGKKVKMPAYRKRIAKTFRPWIARKKEKVIPTACDIPETSFLQAIHFYASYYYTHAYPCPDVFEAMDLTSHIALGMIIQEIISDFAFKLGKESQLEDIEVKREKLIFAKNLAEWNNTMERGGKIPVRDDLAEISENIKDSRLNELYEKRFRSEQRKDECLEMLPHNSRVFTWIRREIMLRRQKENEYIERLSKRNPGAGVSGAGGDDDIDGEAVGLDTGDSRERQGRKSNVNNYWEELRYLKQWRVDPETALVSDRFLVNGYMSDEEQHTGGSEEGSQSEQSSSSEDETDNEQEGSGLDEGKVTIVSNKPQQGSQLQTRPSFAFGSDEEEYESENDSLIYNNDNDSDDEVAPKDNTDSGDNSSGNESDNGKTDTATKQDTGKKDKESVVAEDMDMEISDVDDDYNSDENLEDPVQTIMPEPHATASAPSRIDYEKMNEIVSDSEKGSNSEMDEEEEGDDMPSSVLTTLSDTRFGQMFSRGHDEGNEDDDDEDGGSGLNNGVISQVVLDDSSSEDEGNVVGPSESEDEE
ncbi:hypothetical protein BGX27_006879 [Mortierella sp. AM989]|nr:hypothetical protein BGX27_006879 [Mortierella sp. AM989]